MAGVYIHIPFCKQACHYCNFFFTTSLTYKNGFIGALLKEMEWQRDFFAGDPVNTIYFGGGTPSLLLAEELDLIMNQVHRLFSPPAGAEITLEANPDDIDAEKLGRWRAAGINRLSLGVQSFFEEDLRWMNRAHSAAQAAASIDLALDSGFENLSIDLIYGSPGLSDERWQLNVAEVLKRNIPHLSCYALTVEPGTRLNKMIGKGQSPPMDPEVQARQFLLLMDWLREAGYEHYEISNFAKPGHRSRHNSAYWSGEKYLGLGPSAHSYTGSTRQWNVSNHLKYIRGMDSGEPDFEEEILTADQQFNEYVMTAIRTMEGIDLEWVAKRFGIHHREGLEQRARRFSATGKLDIREDVLLLTTEGKLFADGIAADLFI